MRHNDLASTSFRRHLPTRFLINQCQIITFLILKSDNIESSRPELKGIILPVPSVQIKVTFSIILPFNLVHFFIFSCFTLKLKEMLVDYWGPKVCWPPSQIIGGVAPSAPLPLPTPLSHCRVTSEEALEALTV